MRCQQIEFDFTDNGIRQLMFESHLGFRIEMELHVAPAVHDVGNVQTVDRRESPVCSPTPNEGRRGSRTRADTTLSGSSYSRKAVATKRFAKGLDGGDGRSHGTLRL